jgi:hypothetical protein
MKYYTPTYIKNTMDAIKRARELHKEVDGPADNTTCRECAVDEHNYPAYPCNTIKAIDGK